MYSEVHSTTIYGLSAHIVTVEVDMSIGLPVFEMSGYLTGEVKEARERIKVAIKNSGSEIRPQRIIVNISPADLRKDGTGFDLPIAVGLLLANGGINDCNLKDTIIIGELSLDGTVNSVNGILACVTEAYKQGFKRCIVPYENAKEASLVEGMVIIGVHNLKELITFLNGEIECVNSLVSNTQICEYQNETTIDFTDIRGQEAAKRATLVAAAGMHNIMYVGAPGSGKTMLASRIPTIMPSLTYEESLELTKIYSVAGMLDQHQILIKTRPFRSPHHNITAAALLGGGRIPKPGEITLAGKGVLFLDEMTEYKMDLIEALRQPLEDKRITISRLSYGYTYPADFMLAAAINPCKCGYYPDRSRCCCSEIDIQRFLGKISMPIWDRFDICIQVESAKFEDISDQLCDHKRKKKEQSCERYSSHSMKCMVEQARQIQLERFQGLGISFNSEMTVNEIKEFCPLGTDEIQLMNRVYHTLNLTGRGYHKILKTARTIADLEGARNITIAHLSEAVSYRNYNTTIAAKYPIKRISKRNQA